jgi:hypothetical protein
MFLNNPETVLDNLIRLTVSGDPSMERRAYKQLQNVVMSSNIELITEWTPTITAFQVGSISQDLDIQMTCANSISVLITKRILYRDQPTGSFRIRKDGGEVQHSVMDAVMILTGS